MKIYIDNPQEVLLLLHKVRICNQNVTCNPL